MYRPRRATVGLLTAAALVVLGSGCAHAPPSASAGDDDVWQVMVRGEPRCARYQTNPDGSRTCVRYDTPLETRWTTLKERLRVKRLGG